MKLKNVCLNVISLIMIIFNNLFKLTQF